MLLGFKSSHNIKVFVLQLLNQNSKVLGLFLYQSMNQKMIEQMKERKQTLRNSHRMSQFPIINSLEIHLTSFKSNYFQGSSRMDQNKI